jgi:delta14-sterol reductase
MQTERGTKLLTSGWWGRSRHPVSGTSNRRLSSLVDSYRTTLVISSWGKHTRFVVAHTTDTSSLAWCLPTGFNTPITYFYFAYFAVLLLHRQIRDDEACKAKYGKDWEKVRVVSVALVGLS